MIQINFVKLHELVYIEIENVWHSLALFNHRSL